MTDLSRASYCLGMTRDEVKELKRLLVILDRERASPAALMGEREMPQEMARRTAVIEAILNKIIDSWAETVGLIDGDRT